VVDRFMTNTSSMFDKISEIIVGVAEAAEKLPSLMLEFGGLEEFRK
jgi:hypothetical protein